jgi:hypothetical protein
MPQRRLVGAQLIHLMLREIADDERLRAHAFAVDQRELARERFQERRLAGSVRAEQSDAIAGEQIEVDSLKHGRAALVAERRVVEAKELARGDVDRRKRELERAVDVRGGDPLHPLDRLDAALRLLRLRRLRAKAVDERLQMCDLPLLLRVGGLLLRELQRPLGFELRVVAAVCAKLQSIDVHDRVDDGVEEVAIVRHQHQRSRIACEPVLEPQHGVEIEMVGRLVEQQQVGARRERLREIEAHPPSAGEARDRIGVSRLREAEAREKLAGACAGGVATDRLEPMVPMRERLAACMRIVVVTRFRGRELALDVAQLAIAIEHVFDRGRRNRRRLLRDVRDRPSGRQLDIAGVGRKLAADRREQARLAAAVCADEPDALSRVDRGARVFEQPLRAARERHVRDADQSV